MHFLKCLADLNDKLYICYSKINHVTLVITGNKAKSSTMNRKHEVFITEAIRHGDMERAYSKAYPNAKPESCKSAGSRLYNLPEIKQQIDDGRAEATGRAYEKAKQEAAATITCELLSLQEKRQELARIVRRQQSMNRYYKFKDGIEVKEVPVDNPFIIMRAIELDTRLEAASLPKPNRGAPPEYYGTGVKTEERVRIIDGSFIDNSY